jgi:tetratricopeptide (TPR) repeat protein
VAGRKDLHTCQKHQPAARIPVAGKSRSPGLPAIPANPANRPAPAQVTTPTTCTAAAWNFSAGAAPPRPLSFLLERAAAAEPQSRSVLEGLARAQFDAGWYAAAAGNFRRIVEASPSDDYAQFGLGLALARTGDPGAAAEHLALAAAMAPDRRHYADALRSVRATLRARSRDPRENPADQERSGPGN